MPELLDKLFFYLDFPFVRYAIIVGVLVSLCSSLLGVTLVLKRYSYIGDGLSHVAFGALSIAAVLKITNNMLIILPITIAVAVLLLCSGKKAKVKGDAAIAMVSVGALAIGYLLMNIFSTSANISGDVCTTLFGSTSILTLKVEEVYLCIALSVAVLAVFVIFYHKIFAITFDENFAQATGVRVVFYNFLVAVIIAVIIVLAMNLVGALLVSALVVFPALSAMRLFKSFFSVTVAAAVISVLCSLLGILIAILAGTPVGSTIVAMDIVVFAIISLISLIRDKRA
ncbi:MAG: metal ABC transporter permease [Fibrobacter sp.]|nr:metal ABC transporter permease [Fibrobacter sp.]